MNRFGVVFTLIVLAFAFEGDPAAARAMGPNTGGECSSSAKGSTAIRQGGDTIADAVPITNLPFHDTGTTVGYADDYFEPCETQATGAPDVVYSYTPASDQFIRIATCGSIFDTKLYVYMDSAESLLVCNDTGSWCPQIWDYVLAVLRSVPVHAGHTYYIVVDGAYSVDQGAYVLDVGERTGPGLCEAACPPGAILEGEPECHDGYVDAFNGGCNSTPPVFTLLTCENDPLWVCGETGRYNNGTTEDEDWYEFTLGEARTLSISACANTEIDTWLLRPDPECPSYAWLSHASAYPFEAAAMEVSLAPGRYWYYIHVNTYGSISSAICGEARYVFEIEGFCPTPTAVGAKSWGSVKQLFR